MSGSENSNLDRSEEVTSDNNNLKITDLNEYCLTEIVKLLNSDDLVHLCQVNTRFLPAIDKVVPKKEICCTINNGENGKPLGFFLKLFGHRIVNLKICGYGTTEKKIIEGFVKKYCANGNVKKCNFRQEISKEFIEGNTKFFESLESVDVSCGGMFDILTKPIKLKEIKVMGYDDINPVLSGVLTARAKEIETMKISLGVLSQIHQLPKFHAVKFLSLFSLWEENNDYNVLASFPNVQHFTAYVGRRFKYLDNILQLKHLKKLRLYFHDKPSERSTALFKHLKTQVTLESLRVSFQYGPSSSRDLLNNICGMTNLKELYLDLSGIRSKFRPLSNENIVLNIAVNLKQLRIFAYRHFHPNPKDIADFKRMSKFVDIAENLQTLIFYRKDISYDVFNQFHDELTKSGAQRKTALNVVVMVENKYYRGKELFLQKNKWLKMRISIYQCLALMEEEFSHRRDNICF